MENASKALIMAGGMIIALLIIGALLLMFNQIGAYEKGSSISEKSSQIATFNQEYAQYADSDIKGYQLISLINKAVDFNKKVDQGGVENFVDNKKITIRVTLGNDFVTDHGDHGTLKTFSKNEYQIKDSNNSFFTTISYFRGLENTYTLGVMSKLSANYDYISKGEKTVKDVVGKDINIDITNIEKYREYSEFKSSTFVKVVNPKYDNGQIVELSFKYKKER